MPDPVTDTPAVGYVRVSTPEQKREGVSPAAQAQAIRDYASLRGLALVEVIEDLGISAYKPLAQRPGGKRLLAKITSGEARAVVGLKLDRLFRNAEDCLKTVGEWDKADIALHLVNQGGASIDSRSATGRFPLTIVAGMAEMDRNMGAEQTREVRPEGGAGRARRDGTVQVRGLTGSGWSLTPRSSASSRTCANPARAGARTRGSRSAWTRRA